MATNASQPTDDAEGLAYGKSGVRTAVQPRPSITSYGAVPTGLNQKINRIEMYRTRRKRYQLWKPKYIIHTLALCDNAVYEIFPPDHKMHPPLFGDAEEVRNG